MCENFTDYEGQEKYLQIQIKANPNQIAPNKSIAKKTLYGQISESKRKTKL